MDESPGHELPSTLYAVSMRWALLNQSPGSFVAEISRPFGITALEIYFVQAPDDILERVRPGRPHEVRLPRSADTSAGHTALEEHRNGRSH